MKLDDKPRHMKALLPELSLGETRMGRQPEWLKALAFELEAQPVPIWELALEGDRARADALTARQHWYKLLTAIRKDLREPRLDPGMRQQLTRLLAVLGEYVCIMSAAEKGVFRLVLRSRVAPPNKAFVTRLGLEDDSGNA